MYISTSNNYKLDEIIKIFLSGLKIGADFFQRVFVADQFQKRNTILVLVGKILAAPAAIGHADAAKTKRIIFRIALVGTLDHLPQNVGNDKRHCPAV